MDIDPPNVSNDEQSSAVADDGFSGPGKADPQWLYNQRRASHPQGRPSTNAQSSNNLTMNDDFRHVSPLNTQTTGGMDNLKNDLSSHLPFQSQASPNHPSKPAGTPGSSRADLPKPPKPPLKPQKLTQASWAYYLQQMTQYIGHWNQFNALMVSHFQNRCLQSEEMEKGPAGGMVEGWLGAVGETETLGGWNSYIQSLKVDESARTHWNMACERHYETIGRHDKLRNQILKGNLAPS